MAHLPEKDSVVVSQGVSAGQVPWLGRLFLLLSSRDEACAATVERAYIGAEQLYPLTFPM
jgi:hypothetical protein